MFDAAITRPFASTVIVARSYVPGVTPLDARLVVVDPLVVTSPVRFPLVTDVPPEKTAMLPFVGDPVVDVAQFAKALKSPITAVASAIWPLLI
jgi:hypothetical protein